MVSSSRTVVGGTSSGPYRDCRAGVRAASARLCRCLDFSGRELEGARDRVEDLLGGPHVASLLHALVVVGAHPGKQGEFLAPQPGHAPPRARFQAEVLRPHPGPAGFEELCEFLPRIGRHAFSIRAREGGSGGPRKRRTTMNPATRARIEPKTTGEGRDQP